MDGARPVRARPYRLSPKAREAADEHIKEPLKAGLIYENGASSWCSPMVVVPKREANMYRITIDYRRVNMECKPQVWPMSSVSDVIEELGANKPAYYSSLDLKAGYFQTP